MATDPTLGELALPPSFQRTITATFGTEGRVWLERLPALLREATERWSLTLLPPFELSYNYVAPAVRADGSEAVLKVGVPNPELTTEIEALRLYNGQGAALVLEDDAEQGMLLMDRVRPGAPLVSVRDDEQATHIAAEVMQRLWRPLAEGEGPFPTVRRWGRSLYNLRGNLGGGTGPIPGPVVDKAIAIHDEMIASSAAPVLLHADLHHWNIVLSDAAGWLAIDPKGVCGEPAYEVGAFLRNPIPDVTSWPDARHVFRRRVAQFSEILGLDPRRIVAWSYAQAVLSACWDLEEEGQGEIWLRAAELSDERL
jgi:streptomycin 6-kinase